MILRNIGKQKLNEYRDNLFNYIKKKFEPVETKYVDLGVKTVRILNYSKEFTHLIEKQLTYCLKDSAPKYDDTIVLWQESDVYNLYYKIAPEYSPKNNIKSRIEMIAKGKRGDNFLVFDDNYSVMVPVINSDPIRGIVEFSDIENNIYFLGVKDLSPEEFIKEGHIFVQIFNKILKTPNTNLVHGASVGIDDNGILFCARGQRGKSTLAVLSMMKGFEYVSDDYLTLEKTDNGLFASPVYSIITLSPRMYNELYDKLENSRFLFNNARKDKYVINIANFHDRFKTNYPIKVCMFPEIVSDKEPSVVKCDKEEKGRAIVQLIQSSVCQMQDITNQTVIKKIFNMVKDFEFYKINLCNDIDKNTQVLREFIKNYKYKKDETKLNRILADVTFDIANIIDTQTFTIYTMNKFATNVYENIIHGVNIEKYLKELSKNKEVPLKVYSQIYVLVDIMKKMGLIDELKDLGIRPRINKEGIAECGYNISFIKYGKEQIEELIKEI